MNQDVYNAVRQQIYNGDVGEAIQSAMREVGISFYFDKMANQFADMVFEVGSEYKRPSVIYKPVISIDGNQYCAMYGSNPMEGICGFGTSPALAMADFDKEWAKEMQK